MRFRSLLTNLRKLTMNTVAVSLPALQPVATRLHELELRGSRLQGSADGFLTRGWTALTTLSLEDAEVEDATVTAALKLPALETLDIIGFRHQGGVLQLDQLAGGCPNIRVLSLQLDNDMVQARAGRGPCCSFFKLGRLAEPYIYTEEAPLHGSLDVDLPPSLTLFLVTCLVGSINLVDLFWALWEALNCMRRGALLRKVTCFEADAFLQPAHWGASLDEQYRRLGGQLSSLRELEVEGGTEQLVCAVCAVVSSAPLLTCVKFTIMEMLPCMEFSPICSASLESITMTVRYPSCEVLPPPLVLTFLPGCIRLQTVHLRLPDEFLNAGTSVATAKIRCHCVSPTCLVPMDVRGCANLSCEIGVQFLPGPPSPQGVQRYTVLYICHAAGYQQPLVWGHVVMPGSL